MHVPAVVRMAAVCRPMLPCNRHLTVTLGCVCDARGARSRSSSGTLGCRRSSRRGGTQACSVGRERVVSRRILSVRALPCAWRLYVCLCICMYKWCMDVICTCTCIHTHTCYMYVICTCTCIRECTYEYILYVCFMHVCEYHS